MIFYVKIRIKNIKRIKRGKKIMSLKKIKCIKKKRIFLNRSQIFVCRERANEASGARRRAERAGERSEPARGASRRAERSGVSPRAKR